MMAQACALAVGCYTLAFDKGGGQMAELSATEAENAVYVAALGNDPAALMQGFFEAKARADAARLRVILVSEPSETKKADQRRPRLEQWLKANGAIDVSETSIESISTTFQQVSDVFTSIGGIDCKIFVDATGGTKLLSVALWESAYRHHAELFLQNIHGDQQVQTLLPSYSKSPPRQPICLSDFLEVYLPVEEVKQHPITDDEAAMLRHYNIISATMVIEYLEHSFAVYLEATRLVCVSLTPFYQYKGEGRSDFTRVSDASVQLGGGAAKVIVLLNELDTEWIEKRRRQAKASGVEVCASGVLQQQKRQNSQVAAAEAQNPSPEPIFSGFKRGRGGVLIGVASGETMPLVMSGTHRPNVSSVAILASPEMIGQAGRCQKYFQKQGHEVAVLDGITAKDIRTIAPRVREVLQNAVLTQRPIIINLNGGTAPMVLELWRAIRESGQQFIADYIQDIGIYQFKPNKKSDNIEIYNISNGLFPGSIKSQMAINGIFFRPVYWKLLENLYQLSLLALDEVKQPRMTHRAAFASAFSAAFKVKMTTNADPAKNTHIEGKAREYMFYYEVCHALNASGAEIIAGGEFIDQEWSGAASSGSDFSNPIAKGPKGPINLSNQVDIVIRHKNRLYLVEVKPNLESSLDKDNFEHLNTTKIAKRAIGRFGRSLVVAERLRKNTPKDESFFDDLDEALDHTGTRGWLSLWVREAIDLPKGVYRFPDDLIDFIQKLQR
jgi:hypothetical protein